jgi:hypothetical protein
VISTVVGQGLGVVLESGSSGNVELIDGERFDSRINRSIGKKLLHFEAQSVGPVGGGGSQVVGRRFTVEWVGGKPSKTSIDEIRLSEFGGKFDKSPDEGFFSRFLGTVKFIGGESSVEVEGISTLIEGGQWVGGWQRRSFLSGGSIGFNVLDCAQSINSGEARR